ncbi:hypothetical protein DPMN_102623 [Dreissena polymorpha]|uniref:Uncharacterized protein n=1 Tax=Dreissena polymorpha TaxID=45954 RepID=A0A9D4RB17_DREPO|nr:hypothetical protein DPMN_102623 [Dreissena polymorpha]
MVIPDEAFPTHCACERPLPCVNAHVLTQVTAAGELGRTEHACVLLQVRKI